MTSSDQTRSGMSVKGSTFVLLFTVVALLLFLTFYLTQTQRISRTWQGNGFTLAMSSDYKGKVFSFERDGKTINGKWKLSNDSLYFTPDTLHITYEGEQRIYVTAGDTLQASGSVRYNEERDTLLINMDAAPTPPLTYEEAEARPKFKLQQLGIPHIYTLKGLDETLTLKTKERTFVLQGSGGKTVAENVNNLLRGLLGLFSLLLIAWIFSRNRRAINWNLVVMGVSLQILFALAVLKVGFIRAVFQAISSFFVVVLDFSAAGATFLFGKLITDIPTFGFIFAFQVLPTIVFFSALSAVLYYFGILQKIVFGFAWVMKRTMGLTGSESLAAAANIFIGQTEAPLVIKPYLEKMTKSEMMCLMTGGMATIAGGVFAAYVGYLGGTDPEQKLLFATHLLSASIMSAPAAIVAAKMLFPERPDLKEAASDKLEISSEKIGSNVLDAIANGTTDGLKLAVNVAAMLLVFLAFIKMFDYILFDLLGYYTGLNDYISGISEKKYEGLRLKYVFGFLFAPLAWLLGVPSPDIVSVGQLLGEKTILNEFVAYGTMGEMKAAGALTAQKSLIIATYALCGFANFGSIGIQLGGIGAIAPGQRKTLAQLGVLALIGGTIACFMTGVIAGMLVG